MQHWGQLRGALWEGSQSHTSAAAQAPGGGTFLRCSTVTWEAQLFPVLRNEVDPAPSTS